MEGQPSAFRRASPRRWFHDPLLGPLLLVATATLLSRILFRSRHPYDFDPANYVLAVGDFDIGMHQPHPPGSPVFVMLARVLQTAFSDPNLCLEIVVWLGTLVAIGAIAAWTRASGGSAMAACLVFASHPLVWKAGEMAEPYIFDAALAALALCLATAGGSTRLLGLSAVLGLGAGFRPSAGAFLIPLWAYAMLRDGHPRTLIAGGSVLALGGLLWFVPLLLDSGGWLGWNEAHEKLEPLFAARSVLFGAPIEAHARMLARLGGWAAFLCAPALAAAAVGLAWGRLRGAPVLRFRRDEILALALVGLPPLAFYGLVHFMKPYYVLALAPLTAWVAGQIAARLPPRPRHVLVATLVALQAGWFFSGYALMGDRSFGRASWGSVRAHDLRTQRNLALVAELPAELPFVFEADGEAWPGGARILQYSFPDRDFAYLVPGAGALIGRQFYRDADSVFRVESDRLSADAEEIGWIEASGGAVRTLPGSQLGAARPRAR